MSKFTHSQHWGAGKIALFWIGAFVLLVAFRAFAEGSAGAGLITGLVGLVICGGALKIPNKNQWND